MQIITIHFFSNFRTIANLKTKEYEFDQSDVTIMDLMQKVATDYPEMKPLIFEGEQKFSDTASILVNGEDIRALENGRTLVSPTDRVAIFKAVGGG
jgi:MoaD family protein